MNSIYDVITDIVVDNQIQWSKLENKTVLITGATGLVGSIFAKALLKANEGAEFISKTKLFLMSRSNEKLMEQYESSEYVKLINNLDLIENEKIDFIIHFASPTKSEEFINDPVGTLWGIASLTKRLLEIGHKNKSKFLYISSMEVYGQIFHEDVSEKDLGYIDIEQSRSSYPMGKRFSEALCHAYKNQYGIDIKIARLTLTFGPGISANDNRVFAQFARSVLAGTPIVLHTKGETKRDYIHIADAVRALFYILLIPSQYSTFNISNKNTYISIKDLAMKFAIKRGGNVVINSEADAKKYAPNVEIKLNTDKLESLGWHPKYSLESMINDLLEYVSVSSMVRK